MNENWFYSHQPAVQLDIFRRSPATLQGKVGKGNINSCSGSEANRNHIYFLEGAETLKLVREYERTAKKIFIIVTSEELKVSLTCLKYQITGQNMARTD